MSNRVLIIDDMHESITQMLADIGYVSDYMPKITRNEILALISEYEVLFVRSKTSIDKELIDRAAKLKVVGRAGAGIDKLDIDYLKKKGIKIINAPEGNRDAVGEHAVGMLLMLNNNLAKSDQEIRNFQWDREGNRGYEIKGKTIGVFGFGNMGQSFAQRLSGFECEILAYDKYKSGYTNDFVREVEFDVFKRETQILSIHVPLTQETKAMFSRKLLDEFPRLEILINTARGEVVVLNELLDMLIEKKIRGACLDVLEHEKFSQLNNLERDKISKLGALQNVVLSPHVAGWSFESYRRINSVLVDKLRNLSLLDLQSFE